MSFLLPLGLLALLTLPIIVVLHLLRERRRRVAVPSLMHWQHLARRQTAERVRRLPLTLLLLLHLLAATLLGLALGRPQIAGRAGGARQLAVVLDLSTSMATREGESTRFAQAQQRALALLRSLGPGDSATLLAAGTRARVIASGGPADLARLNAAIDTLEPGGTGADLAGALTLAEAVFAGPRRRAIVVLTDGGPTGAPLPSAIGAALDWQQVGTPQPNRAIVALAARAWGANVQVYARIANYGAPAFDSTVTLYGDDRALGTRAVALAPNGETELTWTLPAAYAHLRAALNGHDSLPQDDEAQLSLAQARPLTILLVSARPDGLRRVLAAVPDAQVTTRDPAGYQPAAGAPGAALTVFDSFLPGEWPAGATLAINPPAGSPLLEVAAQLHPSAGELSRRSPLFAGLGLDGVSFGPLRQVALPGWAETLLAKGGAPLIVRGRVGTHEIAIWSFDPAATNLPNRLAYPLLMARTVRDLTPPPLPQSVQAGLPLTLRPDARAAELRIAAPGGRQTTRDARPQLTLDDLTQPGLYQIEERAAGASLFRSQLPVNAGSALESDLRPQPAPSIAQAPNQPATAERQLVALWPWLALGALALLLLEWGYIHR
ncbi:MAG: VWA domain-containing protein [Kouleothrix sp.]|jgi:hypothetical protein|nr:VWA domain-containing protein [Kouleothrix sp.]